MHFTHKSLFLSSLAFSLVANGLPNQQILYWRNPYSSNGYTFQTKTQLDTNYQSSISKERSLEQTVPAFNFNRHPASSVCFSNKAKRFWRKWMATQRRCFYSGKNKNAPGPEVIWMRDTFELFKNLSDVLTFEGRK